MPLLNINWKPTDRQLRQFGMIALVALPLLGWWWSDGSGLVIAVCAAVGASLCAVGWLRPQWNKPVFLGLCIVCFPIGMVVSEVALLLIYFGLFAPMALLFRLLGRDRLDRRRDPQAKSYWQPKRQPSGAGSYLRQY